ncbi:TetR/AcrR family transcriptional regulator [Streptosporangium sp. 'caverna']|uniref:TetR/AcrR family transcriptional regulator n=1 Tax=Streptosporangium sp. 'caverna' TaxID=2202249 RepID=UPI000D7D91FE|nr:TetR/AcrR family transcriptional regulator [Streptosporangium sp. 'caverna']AWS41697.1 TetR/AcrR family transcriptional regulator [Streptosporangium sp. 'caverna']
MARFSARSADAERDLRADRILNAARELLVSWGYRRITIDEVARRAGVGKGTVYLHFSTKEQLFMTVMTASHLRMVELFLRDLDEDPAALLLSRMARSVYTRAQEDPVVRAIFTGDTDTLGSLIQVVSTAPGDLAEERERAMDEYFELLRERGVLRADSSVQDQRHAFVAILIGFLTMEPAAKSTAGDMLTQVVRLAFEVSDDPERLNTLVPHIRGVLRRMVDRLHDEIRSNMNI